MATPKLKPRTDRATRSYYISNEAHDRVVALAGDNDMSISSVLEALILENLPETVARRKKRR